MAAEFNTGVLTARGQALLAKWQSGRCVPQIIKAAVGSGSYAAGESIASRTALKSQKMVVGFSSMEVINPATLSLKFIISNNDLRSGFRVTEIGIYAVDPDIGEILYSIAVTKDAENADWLPAYNGQYPSTIMFQYQMEVSNASNITFAPGSGGYALAEDVEALDKKVKADEAILNALGLSVVDGCLCMSYQK